MSNHDELTALGISDTDHAHIIELLEAGAAQLVEHHDGWSDG
jgi:hypothetical protein